MLECSTLHHVSHSNPIVGNYTGLDSHARGRWFNPSNAHSYHLFTSIGDMLEFCKLQKAHVYLELAASGYDAIPFEFLDQALATQP
jgi:hypothetical protein